MLILCFLMAFTLFCVTSIGVFLIYKFAPFEDFTYDSSEEGPQIVNVAGIVSILGFH
ncbi:MAG: hypothetical protein CM1200mP22_28980 [Dehalococcoidia bacterium]|nr:MAG: hypothetical protein CM1200mP22_28980 [Dehalococcoidia bacterium]